MKTYLGPRRIATPKQIAGAGLTLMSGYMFGAFIPFKKLKNYRFKGRRVKFQQN